ncbi:MAG: hypothetical protein K0R76_1349 [Alphaproteobacteria bacterium]|jgi:hypothetical protein|nr:hypothetical protein [Alphaproteobacteria bacterium]
MSSKKHSPLVGAIAMACLALSSYATLATDTDINTIKKGVGLPEKNRQSIGSKWAKEMKDKASKEQLEADEAKKDRIAKIGESIKKAKQEPAPEVKSPKAGEKTRQQPKMEATKHSSPNGSVSTEKPVNKPQSSQMNQRKTGVNPVPKQGPSSNQPRQGRTMRNLMERMGTNPASEKKTK